MSVISDWGFSNESRESGLPSNYALIQFVYIRRHNIAHNNNNNKQSSLTVLDRKYLLTKFSFDDANQLNRGLGRA